jgi:hypothetical protein
MHRQWSWLNNHRWLLLGDGAQAANLGAKAATTDAI